MKIVKVTHRRCADYSATTFAWAPDDWDRKQVNKAVQQARDGYLAALKVAKAEEAPPNDYRPYSKPPFEKYPTDTVEIVQRMWDSKKTVYDAWEEEQRTARKTFATFLREAGFTALWDHADHEIEVDWGHHHGLGIDPGETDTDTLPKPLVAAGREDDDDGLW